jgi:hypothetical protein
MIPSFNLFGKSTMQSSWSCNRQKDSWRYRYLTIMPACQTTHAVFPLQRNSISLEVRLRQSQDDRKRHDAEIQDLQSTKTRLEVC